MLISSIKALSPLPSFCIAQHCSDMILMFARMKKSVLLLGCYHYRHPSSPSKSWRGRRKENTPQTLDNILYLLETVIKHSRVERLYLQPAKGDNQRQTLLRHQKIYRRKLLWNIFFSCRFFGKEIKKLSKMFPALGHYNSHSWHWTLMFTRHQFPPESYNISSWLIRLRNKSTMKQDSLKTRLY